MSPRVLLALCAALSLGSSVHAAGKADPIREYRAKVKALPGLTRTQQERARAQLEARTQKTRGARNALSTLNEANCRSWLCGLAAAASPQALIDEDYETHANAGMNEEQAGYDREHATAMARHTEDMTRFERARGAHEGKVAAYDRELAAHREASEAHTSGKAALATWEIDVKKYDDAVKAAQTSRFGKKRRDQGDAARARLGERPVKPVVPPAPGGAPVHPGEGPTAPAAPERQVAKATKDALAKAATRRQNLRSQFPSYQQAANELDYAAQRLGLTGRVGQLHARETSAASAINQLQREVDAYAAELERMDVTDTTDHAADVRQAGVALQQRITAKVRGERAALQKRLKTAPPEDLYEEALDLMADAQDLAQTTSIRKETVATASGQSSSSGGSSRSMRAGGRDGHGGGWGAMEDESSYSESHSSWKSERRQLLLDAEVLTMAVSPGEKSYRRDEELTLPEARLVVEKVLRAQQLYRALVKRDPQLAANIQRWMQHSQIVINYSAENYRENGSFTLQVRRLGPDLRGLERIGLIDAERAADLDDDADERLASGL